MGSGESKELKERLIESIGDHGKPINCMAISEDRSLIATGSDDNTVRMWSTNAEETECLGIFKGHTSYITCVALYECFVISASDDATIRKWDMTDCECLQIYKGHQTRILRLMVNGEFIFSTSHDKTAKVWLFNEVDLEGHRYPGGCVKTFEGHTSGVNTIIYIPDTVDAPSSYADEELTMNPKDIVITGSSDCKAKKWNFSAKKCSLTFTGHTGAITCMTVDEFATTLYTGSQDNTIRSWNVKNGQRLLVMKEHTGPVMCLKLVNELIYSGSQDGTAISWTTKSDKPIHIYKGHKHSVVGLLIAKGILFTASGDSTIRAFDASKNTVKRILKGHDLAVTCFALAGNKLFSGSSDCILRVWDILNIDEDDEEVRDEEFDEDDEEENEAKSRELEDKKRFDTNDNDVNLVNDDVSPTAEPLP